MRTFEVTIEITEEELKKLERQISRAKALEGIGLGSLTFEAKIAARVIKAFLDKFGKKKKSSDGQD